MNILWSNVFRFPAWLANNPIYWIVAVFILIPSFLALDQFANLYTQWPMALILWWALVGAMTTLSRDERRLILVLVVVATILEFSASLGMNWYAYRLGNVPPWIPPGHGIVFLTALLWCKLPIAKQYAVEFKITVSLLAIAYCSYGLVANSDVGGAIGGLLFLLWLWLSGKGNFYVMLWFAVCYLEIIGVTLGAWNWAETVPLTQIHEGNPPSGIVGMYGAFDLLSFVIAASIVKRRTQSSESRML